MERRSEKGSFGTAAERKVEFIEVIESMKVFEVFQVFIVIEPVRHQRGRKHKPLQQRKWRRSDVFHVALVFSQALANHIETAIVEEDSFAACLQEAGPCFDLCVVSAAAAPVTRRIFPSKLLFENPADSRVISFSLLGVGPREVTMFGLAVYAVGFYWDSSTKERIKRSPLWSKFDKLTFLTNDELSVPFIRDLVGGDSSVCLRLG
ncbi:hypothetical protein HK096_003884 [Nowakowskiella sp. JEL0078]|nr:hypothetical protein HK096_003884 [Nowakowskiella sp. JEL0078]